MSWLLRTVSAGGWLANMLNQASGFSGTNMGHDESARPRMLWVWVTFFLVVGIGFAADLPRVPRLETAVVAAIAFGLAALALAGWFSGLVPFTAEDGAAPAPATVAAAEPVPVRVTGVVEDEVRKLRLYRHRRATLGVGRLDVEGLNQGGRQGPVAVRPDFGREAIWNAGRGTAWLVSGGRPAIRLERHVGAVVLAFDDAATRDRVLERIEGGDWPARPIDEPDDGPDD